ncbi:MAG: M24 family metallopeptidase [Mogibacterium sp.]|nr:M24 family metallopeptidase [Mogibacterium sp.]
MRYSIVRLQEAMKYYGIQVYYVPSGDPHGSEFVHDHFKCCEFLTGFSGENATLIVLPESAFLWTDGRFFLQAEQELAGSGITLMKIGETGVPTPLGFLTALAEGTLNDRTGEYDGYVLGFDGSTVSGASGMRFEDELEDLGVEIVTEHDLASEIWDDMAERGQAPARPVIEAGEIWELPIDSAGETVDSKFTRVREAMAERSADYLLVSDLMEIAWLFNLRGSDIAYTPVFYAYALIGPVSARLFTMAHGNYDEITDAITAIETGKTIWYDPETTSYALCYAAGDGVGLVEETSPIQRMKAAKNDIELAASKRAHVRDGAAMVRYLNYIKNHRPDDLNEYEAGRKLDAIRLEGSAISPSFETIAAYGANGAIIHYTAPPYDSALIGQEGFLLVDSGGQYMDGTTDITRTIAVGPLTQEMIDNYTHVLRSHIAMATAVIGPDQTGRWLDSISREPLKEIGLDFNHGLSHGVGHVLSVHEPPNIMSKIADPQPLIPGMIMSDEPGLYFEGRYGIRIENEVYCRLREDRNIVLDTITFCPYERDAINKDLLTDAELKWINEYHSLVYRTLTPLLEGDDLRFLGEACREI